MHDCIPTSLAMKIAFFGTPNFTLEFLDSLTHHGLKPSLVVTGLDVPVSRKLTLTPPAPKLWAIDHEVSYLQPAVLSVDFIQTLKTEKFDLFIVVAYGKILPEELINLPKYGTINVHYSLLPKYRGASPVESAILSGETQTGVCIQQMVYALDAGDILAEQSVAISPTETHIELRERLNYIAVPMLLDLLTQIQLQTTFPRPQDTETLTLCKKIKKQDGLIALTDDPHLLYRKFRAYYTWPGIYFFDTKNGKTLRVKIAQAHMNGDIFVIDTVVPEGRKEMKYTDYQSW
jgi:methionyl-tRNA formyltransferase